MKFSIPSSGSSRRGSPTRTGGFTLPEVLVAMTIFVLLVAGIVSANLFGLKMFQANSTKLNATEWARRTFGEITDQIHSCAAVSVGNLTTNSVFVGLVDGETQQGTAIEIQPGTNTASLIYYFVDLSDGTFRRTVVASNVTSTIILADSVTNAMIFSAQDLSGNVLTNSQNNRVIHLTLDFYQPGQYMQSPYSYQMETSVTRRALQ
jgi:prepilin-type N-terminal cleavage/methylation domain-containing protein